MTKNIFFKIAIVVFILSLLVLCRNENKNTYQPEKLPSKLATLTTDKWGGEYVKISPTEIPDNIIQLIKEQWAVVTAGDLESYNSMTANWGAMGQLWYKDVTFLAIRKNRYTHKFMDKNEYYTLSYFSENYREALNLIGTRSGKDTNKAREANLTPMVTPVGGVSYAEAKMIIECKKIFSDDLDKSKILDKNAVTESYNAEEYPHTLFIGEIVNVWLKK